MWMSAADAPFAGNHQKNGEPSWPTGIRAFCAHQENGMRSPRPVETVPGRGERLIVFGSRYSVDVRVAYGLDKLGHLQAAEA